MKNWQKDPRLWVDHYQMVGFVALIVSGLSPVVGDVVNRWLGSAMFFASVVMFVRSMVMMRRFPRGRL